MKAGVCIRSPHVEEYIEFLRSLKRLCPEHIQRVELFLTKLERALGKSILRAATASEIDYAVFAAAENRKRAYNGGFLDDGANQRFRLGQAAKCYLEWAFGERLVKVNIYPRNNHRRPPQRTPNFHDPKRLIEIRRHMKGLPLREQVMLSLLIDTGMRVSELCRIKIEEVDLVEQVILSYMTKVERWKSPVFTKKTARILRRWMKSKARRPGPWLFPGYEGRPIASHRVRLFLREFSKVVGFRVNPHSLRHSVGGLWKLNGAADSEVMEQLGLIDFRTMKTYTHISTPQLKRAQIRVYSKPLEHTQTNFPQPMTPVGV